MQHKRNNRLFEFLAITLIFYTTRFVARNKDVATKTGIPANLVISTIAITTHVKVSLPASLSNMVNPSIKDFSGL